MITGRGKEEARKVLERKTAGNGGFAGRGMRHYVRGSNGYSTRWADRPGVEFTSKNDQMGDIAETRVQAPCKDEIKKREGKRKVRSQGRKVKVGKSTPPPPVQQNST